MHTHLDLTMEVMQENHMAKKQADPQMIQTPTPQRKTNEDAARAEKGRTILLKPGITNPPTNHGTNCKYLWLHYQHNKRKNHNSALCLANIRTWYYFSHPTNMAFHNLTSTKQLPPNL